jgi:hypothetical protein
MLNSVLCGCSKTSDVSDNDASSWDGNGTWRTRRGKVALCAHPTLNQPQLPSIRGLSTASASWKARRMPRQRMNSSLCYLFPLNESLPQIGPFGEDLHLFQD